MAGLCRYHYHYHNYYRHSPSSATSTANAKAAKQTLGTRRITADGSPESRSRRPGGCQKEGGTRGRITVVPWQGGARVEADLWGRDWGTFSSRQASGRGGTRGGGE
ncbi:unnamed protein product, partial [Ectocarpus sp. 8 AP-2014]